jgi:hypothetical protein
MATLKNTQINDTGFIELTTGKTNNRPAIKPPVVVSFTSTGTTNWTAPSNLYSIEVLVVAGGGGGGGYVAGGGGGAGGVIYRPNFAVTPGTTYTITVGAGGGGGRNSTQTGSIDGLPGSNSVFGSLTAIGGGGGSRDTPGSGGSGGGGSLRNILGGKGTDGQGFNGGSSVIGPSATGGGGGGGGASQSGSNGTSTQSGQGRGGGGGAGLNFSISGTPTWYGGGGGGGGRNGAAGPLRGGGGIGGGGAGQDDSNAAQPGQDNTGGGGGGGGGSNDTNSNGAAGGSGIVIIKYYIAETGIDTRGLIRFNSDINDVEFFNGSNWLSSNSEKNFAGHNLLTFSDDLSNVVWDNPASRATRITTGVLDPYGGTGAATYKRIASDGDLIYRIHSGTIGRPYTYSVWIRRRLGSGAIRLTVGDNVSGPDLNITSEWTRYFRTFVPTSTSVRAYVTISTQNDEIDVFGGQLEENVTTPGPFVRTSNAISPLPTSLGGYTYHTYRNIGTSGFTPALSGNVEVLVVAGGGAGGGGDVGAGGGAGGVIYRNFYPVKSDISYTVTVGAGGVGVANSALDGGNGENSKFDNLVAIGGGGGAGWGGGNYGQPGGSGGGSTNNFIPPPGIRNQGYPGGKFGLGSLNYPCPGGGGAGGAGGASEQASKAGDGGFGVYLPQFAPAGGSPPGWFGGGGGGGVEGNSPASSVGIGGYGGGGAGGRQTDRILATAGTPNTGGGGGGEDPAAGASGGSGIVIVRYRYE